MPGYFTKIEVADPHLIPQTVWEKLPPSERTLLTEHEFSSQEWAPLDRRRFRIEPESYNIDLGGLPPIPWSGAEAVLMFNGDGSEANLGYGNYLVSVRLVGGNWDALDPNMAFGLFLYENPDTGPDTNPNREIDLAEISRWGWNHTGICPFGPDSFDGNFPNKKLCEGDARFALQKIRKANKEGGPLMVDRYDIGKNNEVTLVVRWHKGKEVIFEKYNGGQSLGNLPMPPINPWTANPDNVPTPPIFKTIPPKDVKDFVPDHTANSCERFHINFWFGNYSAGLIPNPPPSSPQEVIITNFEFRP